MNMVVGFVQNHQFNENKKLERKLTHQNRTWAALEKLHAEGWKPVFYASKTLNEAKLKVSIIELKL